MVPATSRPPVTSLRPDGCGGDPFNFLQAATDPLMTLRYAPTGFCLLTPFELA
jgi:hypothetical protein